MFNLQEKWDFCDEQDLAYWWRFTLPGWDG